jgi:hypothetical protein
MSVHLFCPIPRTTTTTVIIIIITTILQVWNSPHTSIVNLLETATRVSPDALLSHKDTGAHHTEQRKRSPRLRSVLMYLHFHRRQTP